MPTAAMAGIRESPLARMAWFTWFLPFLPGQVILDKFSNCDSGLAEQSGFPVTVIFSEAYGMNCQNGAVAGLDRCNDGNTLASPTVAVDDTDPTHVYMAWAEMNASLTGQDVMVSDSTNGGLEPWTTPVAANGSATATRFMPWLGAWGGVAYVGWYDRRFGGKYSRESHRLDALL